MAGLPILQACFKKTRRFRSGPRFPVPSNIPPEPPGLCWRTAEYISVLPTPGCVKSAADLRTTAHCR